METISSICRKCGHHSQKQIVESSLMMVVVSEWRCPKCRADARDCKLILESLPDEEEEALGEPTAVMVFSAAEDEEDREIYREEEEEEEQIPLEVLTADECPRTEGLDLDQLFSLPCDESTDQSIFCGVCQEPAVGSQVTTLPRCGHRYHKLCINPWVLSHNSCPVCREQVVPQRI
jgi:hypothetical protein